MFGMIDYNFSIYYIIGAKACVTEIMLILLDSVIF